MPGGREDSSEFLKKSWFSPSLQNITSYQTKWFLDFFPVSGIQWAHLLQKKWVFLSCFEKTCLKLNRKSRFWPFLKSNISELTKLSETCWYPLERLNFQLSRTFERLEESILVFEQSPFPWTLFSIFFHTNFNWLFMNIFLKQAWFELFLLKN